MFAFDQFSITQSDIKMISTKVSSSYHLCVKCFSQVSFDSEMYTKSVAVADFVYISESNESWEKYDDDRMNSL